MNLTDKQVDTICKLQQIDCCAFLVMAPEGFECAKNTELEGQIRSRLAAGTMRATGENCGGFIDETTTD